jgi:hypothetical protein
LSLDAPGEAAILEQSREFEGTVELMQPSSEKLMAIFAEGGIEDPLGSRPEGFKDVIEVLHGDFSWSASATHGECCWPGPPSIERSRVKGALPERCTGNLSVPIIGATRLRPFTAGP